MRAVQSVTSPTPDVAWGLDTARDSTARACRTAPHANRLQSARCPAATPTGKASHVEIRACVAEQQTSTSARCHRRAVRRTSLRCVDSTNARTQPHAPQPALHPTSSQTRRTNHLYSLTRYTRARQLRRQKHTPPRCVTVTGAPRGATLPPVIPGCRNNIRAMQKGHDNGGTKHAVPNRRVGPARHTSA